MTDEERKKLVESMRDFDLANFDPYAALEQAADEIERLAAENDWLRTALRAAQMAIAKAEHDLNFGSSRAKTVIPTQTK